MTVRLARHADAAVLGPLHVESWRAAYAHLLPVSFFDTLDPAARTARFSEMIDEGRKVLVADDGEIHGFVSLGPSRDLVGWGEVYAIYLRPVSWGLGHGSGLLREAEWRLAADGFDRAMLWVLVGNDRGRAFYESRGWTPTDRRQTLDIGETRLAEMVYERDLTGSLRPGPQER